MSVCRKSGNIALKQENGYNKEFSVWTIGYDYNDTNVIYEGSLYVNVQNFDTMKSVFKRWLAEFRAVTKGVAERSALG